MKPDKFKSSQRSGETMSDQYVGEIRIFAGNYAPEGWIFCDGAELSISEYPSLFALIGTTYGGNGQTTFAVPDLRGRIPIHAGINPQTGTNYPIGQKGGVENVTLTLSQIPSHTHAVNVDIEEGEGTELTGMYFADSNISQYSSSEPNGALSPQTVGVSGGGQPHDNMMPFLALNYIIAVQGLFPAGD
jgi:microcystin-dependent protein